MSFFFILSKLLYFFTTPTTWIFGFMLLAFFTKNTKKQRRRYLTAIILFFFFSNGFIFDEFSRSWEKPATHPNDLEKEYDVAVVLGGYSFYMLGSDQLNFFDASDRILQTARLKKAGIVKKLLLSGGTGKLTDREIREADHVKDYLVDIGFKERDILVERESNNTYENALYSKQIIDSLFPNKSIMLVTSSYHMRRSEACFKKLGMDVQPYVVDGVSGPRKYYLDHLFVPNAEYLRHWNGLIHEIVGFVVYWVLGYV
jgi:uncharacterized SAM-binding protein YcdF (DUF218 family)